MKVCVCEEEARGTVVYILTVRGVKEKKAVENNVASECVCA